MKIFELADLVLQGTLAESNNLTSIPSNFMYLLPLNIKNNAITEEGAKYFVDKVGRRFNKSDYLAYGDVVIYQKSDDDFGIFRFTQEFNKHIIPSQFFAVIKSPN